MILMPVYLTHQLTILNCGRIRDLFFTTPSLRKKKGTIQSGSSLQGGSSLASAVSINDVIHQTTRDLRPDILSPVNNRSGVGDGLYYDAAKNGHPRDAGVSSPTRGQATPGRYTLPLLPTLPTL
ncbi:hypothetical protein CEXT_247251 [Caerostris extrusa]|uniref:Uncharacterized protein n=1 Tax=Caerostris extrusa TaxID=172846 RepID=A0AAV4MH02_CAEEX|nr:hypothetical protein CEXT_247251 [Caerostris extrusa]